MYAIYSKNIWNSDSIYEKKKRLYLIKFKFINQMFVFQLLEKFNIENNEIFSLEING